MYDRQLSISDYLKTHSGLMPHQSEIDRMASNNATRQIFVEKRIVKELTIKFWHNSIQNAQAETLKAALRTHAAYIENFLKRPHRIQHRQIRRSLKYHCRQFIEKYAKIRYTSVNGAQKSSLLGATSPQSTVVLILAYRWRRIPKNKIHR